MTNLSPSHMSSNACQHIEGHPAHQLVAGRPADRTNRWGLSMHQHMLCSGISPAPQPAPRRLCVRCSCVLAVWSQQLLPLHVPALNTEYVAHHRAVFQIDLVCCTLRSVDHASQASAQIIHMDVDAGAYQQSSFYMMPWFGLV